MDLHGGEGLPRFYLKASPVSPAPSLWLVMFSQFSLLKFVLARWCLDVASMSRVSQFTVIWGADVVSFGAHDVSFGKPFASTLWDHRAIQGHLGAQRGDLGVQGWISCDFVSFRDYILKVFGQFWSNICVFCSCLFPGHAF